MTARRVLLLLSLFGHTLLAHGANPKVSSLAKEAERLYNGFRFAEAAKVLEEAYALEPNPKLLYNLARCYDNAAENQKAFDLYRKYVALPSTETEPELVRKANQNMDRLRTLLARQEADSRLREAEKARLEREARDAKARAEAEAARAKKQQAEFEARERAAAEARVAGISGRKVAAFVVGGLGLVGLASGATFGLLSVNAKGAFRVAPVVEEKQSLQERTTTFSLIADVSFLVGIASAVTAVILFPKGEQDAPLQLSLAPIPGGALGALSFSMP